MSLLPRDDRFPHFPKSWDLDFPRLGEFPRSFDEMVREMERSHREFMQKCGMEPFWINAGDSLSIGNVSDVVDDANHFNVAIDVSSFKPEELKVNIDGRLLTVEGHHNVKTDNSSEEKSFVRKWTLPPDCNPEAVVSSLTGQGRLSIDAPKVHAVAGPSRNIAIENKQMNY